MDAERIARILDEMGTLLEVRGENPFRCRAYHNAAQRLRGLADDLSEMIADGSLAEVPGIGETMLDKIVRAGHDRPPAGLRRAARARPPPGLVALLRVPGLGPKKIKALHDELSIESLADLRAAAESGEIAELKGFGAKTEAKILEGISIRRVRRRPDPPEHRAPAGRADLRGRPRPARGDPRRGLRQPPPPGRDDRRPRHPVQRRRSRPRCSTRSSACPEVATGAGPRADQGERPAWPTASSATSAGSHDDQFAFALHYFTGSKAHNIAMRRRALARGLTLNEYALEGPDGPIALRDEAELFEALGLALHPPRAARRTSARSRRPRPARLPPLVDARRPDRHVPLPHRLERRRRHPRRDGRGRPGAGLDVPGHRRPLAVGRLRRRPEHRPRPPAVGGDRRAEREATARRSGCSRGPSATSSPTARSTIPTRCSPASTTSSPASTRSSACPARR